MPSRMQLEISLAKQSSRRCRTSSKKRLATKGYNRSSPSYRTLACKRRSHLWIDKNKTNLPITPEQIRTALGDEHVQQVAKSLGIPMDKVVDVLAKFLPAAASAAGPAVAPPPAGAA